MSDLSPLCAQDRTSLTLTIDPVPASAAWIENPFDVAIQGRHDADPREHRRAAQRRDQHQRFDCGLPFRGE